MVINLKAQNEECSIKVPLFFNMEIMRPYGITLLQTGFWFALQLVSCMLESPVFCIYLYYVQLSHASLVFESECNTLSHTAVNLVSPGPSATTG